MACGRCGAGQCYGKRNEFDCRSQMTCSYSCCFLEIRHKINVVYDDACSAGKSCFKKSKRMCEPGLHWYLWELPEPMNGQDGKDGPDVRAYKYGWILSITRKEWPGKNTKTKGQMDHRVDLAKANKRDMHGGYAKRLVVCCLCAHTYICRNNLHRFGRFAKSISTILSFTLRVCYTESSPGTMQITYEMTSKKERECVFKDPAFVLTEEQGLNWLGLSLSFSGLLLL